MRGRVLVAIADDERRARTVATLAEISDLEIAGAVEVRSDVSLVVDDPGQELDYLLLDAGLGDSSVLALCRELTASRPDLGIVLLQDEPTADFMHAAMEAGVRGVLPTSPTVEDVYAKLAALDDWQRRVRSIGLASQGLSETQGRIMVIAGAKGGVGVSTVALHLALLARQATAGSRVCLVDLDLQQHGLRHLLDMNGRRTILDLVPVAESLTPRHVEEALFAHRSGVKILLAPHHGEQAEDVDSNAARHVLGALRSQFDLVVVDAGCVINEASAVAMDLADDLVMVVTPDVPALRAAREKIDLLSRLDVAKTGDVKVLFNRTSTKAEVQPDLGRRITGTDAFKVGLPEDWRHLESIANAAAALELGDSPFRRAITALGRELQLGRSVTPTPAGPRTDADQAVAEIAARGRRSRRDKAGRSRRRRLDEVGQTTVETVFGIVISMALLLVMLQVGLYALATVSSRRAADAAAIIGSRNDDGPTRLARAQQAAKDRVPGFLRVEVEEHGDDTFAATVKVPQIVPFGDISITQTGRYTN
ncbi:AAA family ATPase [Nocardioides sp.]|uniref:AAA family ATPase n=1 Tax=Nocardioides sp. TaxID=35761 RepID=UPI0039E45F9F